ncbi:MAG: NTP transferase domain-containing protein [Candidatus Cloacimonetes bacterium]|nr:NTP transferase domain-containing protein [Candidatus Cloacimonadota bacterium]MBS3767434.1 NTP transferase domain-containing protein [Candidatus Cloacimonadota bacterium]
MRSQAIHGIILAAGYSSRHQFFKPLAKYKNEYYIQNIIHKMTKICHKIIIVSGFREDLLKDKIISAISKSTLDKIQFIYNAKFAEGMFTSVKKAATNIQDFISGEDLVMIHLVDQPQIRQNTYSALVKAAKLGNSDAYIPSYKMKAGHPIIVNHKVISKIHSSSHSKTLRDVLREVKIHYVAVSDRNILKDIDMNEDEISVK